jgi:hypothetical protein
VRLLRTRARHARSGSAPSPSEHALASRALARGGVALLANSGLTAVLGVAFWLAAARMYAPASVGRGSALVSALFTISGLCQLNYSRSLSGLLPSAARPCRLLVSVYGLTVTLSLAIGLVSAFALPLVTAEFSYLNGNLLFIGCFAGAVALWTIFSLEDAVLTSVRRATIIPFENGAYGALKLICLFILWNIGDRSSLGLFVAWILPLVGVIIPVNFFLFRRAVPVATVPTTRRGRRSPRWVRYDFAGYLLWLIGTLPLPVLVLISVGASNAAGFYVPFTIASAIDLLSLNLGNSLTAELSRTKGEMTPATKLYLRRVWITVAILSAMLCIFSAQILEVFGNRYRVEGATILRMLMLAALPRSILFLVIAVQRSRGRGFSILLLQALAALGTLTLGVSLAWSLGAAGTALGWLLASCTAALVSLMFLRARTSAKGSHTERATGAHAGSVTAARAGLDQRVHEMAGFPGTSAPVRNMSGSDGSCQQRKTGQPRVIRLP